MSEADNYPLQIGVNWGQDGTMRVLILQRICSAPPLAEFARAFPVGGYVGIAHGFKSGSPLPRARTPCLVGQPIANNQRPARRIRIPIFERPRNRLRTSVSCQEIRGKSGAGLAVQSQREYNADEAVVVTETIIRERLTTRNQSLCPASIMVAKCSQNPVPVKGVRVQLPPPVLLTKNLCFVWLHGNIGSG